MSWQESRTNERAEVRGRNLGEKTPVHERKYIVRKERREYKRTLRTAIYSGDIEMYSK